VVQRRDRSGDTPGDTAGAGAEFNLDEVYHV
jgi:hypothetical protein